jgi:vanillate/4-hydroxybenzoate decarboxylase subunit D
VTSYPRPSELTLHVEREPVEGACPSCGETDLRRYPVLSEGGWFQVVKCQACLISISRERWARLGPVGILADSL